MFESINEKSIRIKCSEDETQFPIEVLNSWDMTELEIIGGSFTYFPEDISILKKLKRISLVSTKISIIPKEIFELPELTYLSLKNNQIKNLPKLDKKSHIKQLILGRNQLDSEALQIFFTNVPSLQYLDLGHNNISVIPESIYMLIKLRRLNLESNNLQDVPTKLKGLEDLNHLSLTNNPILEKNKNEILKNFNISFE